MNQYIGLILFGTFALLLLLRIPVSFSLGISATVCLFLLDVPLAVVAQKMFTALDSFPIMAIPFFILSGNLMIAGGLSKRLVRFASALLAPVRGGLALASILACTLFGSLSGSGPATVISIGGMVYPELVSRGYKDEKMAGLIATAGSLGPIIPPSIIMVFFGTVTGVSITKMFAGGLGVGLLLATSLFAMTVLMAVIEKWPKAKNTENAPKIWASFKESFFALLMPVIVLGGIYGGFFTPTEAAAVSICYALLVGSLVYKELQLKTVMSIIRDSATSATIVLFIIASSSAFSWLFTYANIAADINNFVFSMHLDYYMFLIVLAIILLIFGTFMDATATIVLLMPMMYPIAMNLHMDPIHFGQVVCFALTLGGLTPPVAVNIFSMASVSGLSMNRIVRGEIPFLILSICVLMVVLFLPDISLFFPSFM
jgi:C4-dicarboxylate transporter DctM subunit